MGDDLYKKIFSKNLKYYMELNNKEQIDLINDLGFNKSAVSTWCNGTRLPRMDKVEMLAQYFHINRSDLIEDKPKNDTKPHRKGVLIPVLGDVAAGIPIEAQENVLDWEEISEDMAKHGEYFCLRIKGDSMVPDIKDGDIVVARWQPDVESGDIAIVKVNGDSATCKRLKKYADHISLISINPNYDPMFFSEEEIETLPVAVIGKVVELRRKL